MIRKRIKAGNTEETRKNYDKEKECLELLRLRGHPNILELFVSYTYRSEYNFLFPRDGMDLEQFLAFDEQYSGFKQNVTYITAIEGLSSALEGIHNLRLNKADHEIDITRIGYHHDVRPRNILVTPSKFVLADFGLSRFKVADAGSRTKWRENMGDYLAPECLDQDFGPQTVGRAIDIWAFGGVIFDLAWHREQGVKGIKQAHSARQGPADKNKWDNQCFFLENEIRPNVIQSSNQLRLTSKDVTSADLLDLAFSMLHIVPQKHPLAADVRRNMIFLIVKSNFNVACRPLKDCAESLPDPSIELHFEVTRLDAWASALGAHTNGLIPKDFINAFQPIEINSLYAEDVLKDIVNTFKSEDVAKTKPHQQCGRFPPSTFNITKNGMSCCTNSWRNHIDLFHQLIESALIRFCSSCVPKLMLLKLLERNAWQLEVRPIHSMETFLPYLL